MKLEELGKLKIGDIVMFESNFGHDAKIERGVFEVIRIKRFKRLNNSRWIRYAFREIGSNGEVFMSSDGAYNLSFYLI